MDILPDQGMEEAYRLLGVHHSASNADINRAFRQKGLELYPGFRNPKNKSEVDGFKKEFEALNEAMEEIRQCRSGPNESEESEKGSEEL